MLSWLLLEGRIGRKRYWIRFALPAVLLWGLAFLLADPWSQIAGVSAWLIMSVGIIKRLHDVGWSGWIWITVFFGGAAVWSGLALILPDLGLGTVAGWIWTITVAGVVPLYSGLVPGVPGPNDYGPDPRGADEPVR